MGCFCRNIVLPPIEPFNASFAVEPQQPLVAAVSAWLSARWLPTAVPWAPDPAWLDLPLPAPPPIPAASLSVLVALVTARHTIQLALDLDPLLPDDLHQLTRVVATLNLRMDLLRPLAEDWRPWTALAQLDAQLDAVGTALAAGLFEPAQVQAQLELQASSLNPSLPSWRALLARLMALAPLVAIANTLKLDLGDPGWVEQLAVTVRALHRVTLPKLADVALVLNLVARLDAATRLQASLGALPFPELRGAVAAKLRAVLRLMPPGVRLGEHVREGVGEQAGGQAGALLGMPALLPNPSLVINAPTVAGAARLTATATARLNWQVPDFTALPLLTVGSPAASLVAGLRGSLGLEAPVRFSPCGTGCDAQAAMRALA